MALQPPQERPALLLTRILQVRCLTTCRLSRYPVRRTALPTLLRRRCELVVIAHFHLCPLVIFALGTGQLVLDQIVQQTNATARQVRTLAAMLRVQASLQAAISCPSTDPAPHVSLDFAETIGYKAQA